MTLAPRAPGRVRIIAGTWRSRMLPVPNLPGLRPTADRVRETLFNWLGPMLRGARCLDLFAGTGALGFEALSRGAARCVFVEDAAPALAGLRDSVQRLGAAERAEIHAGDARRYLEGPAELFDVVFLDPPFATQLIPEILHVLAARWLAPDARVYLESPREGPEIPLPEGWRMMRASQTRQVRFGLAHRVPET